MNAKPFGKIVVALVALFTVSSLAAPPASAQGKQIRSTAERRQHPGGGFWANQRTSRNIQHARDPWPENKRNDGRMGKEVTYFKRRYSTLC